MSRARPTTLPALRAARPARRRRDPGHVRAVLGRSASSSRPGRPRGRSTGPPSSRSPPASGRSPSATSTTCCCDRAGVAEAATDAAYTAECCARAPRVLLDGGVAPGVERRRRRDRARRRRPTRRSARSSSRSTGSSTTSPRPAPRCSPAARRPRSSSRPRSGSPSATRSSGCACSAALTSNVSLNAARTIADAGRPQRQRA